MRATTAPRCRSCVRRRSPATRRPTSSGSNTRLPSLARGAARGTVSACCARPVRFAPRRRFGGRGQRSRRSRASIRCVRSSSAPSIRARCGWCGGSGCFRCCHSARQGRLQGGPHEGGPHEGGPREEQPWHSTPYQALPPVYVQNASLEIAWTRVVRERRTIAGDVLVPFLTEGYEGFDINDAL